MASIGCAKAVDSQMEQARFALDQCFPADIGTASQTACQKALDQATLILTDDPTNVEAMTLASSANMGLAHVDFLQLVKTLLDSQSGANADTNDFSELTTAIRDYETDNTLDIDEDALGRSASVFNDAALGTALDCTAAEKTEFIEQACFQLGAIQALDAFIQISELLVFIPVAGDPTAETVDPTAITQEVFDAVIEDGFLNSEENLEASGLSNEDLTAAVRTGQCLCESNSVDGTWNAICLRDLMRCNTSERATEDLEQDYDADGVLVGDHVEDCAVLNVSTTAAVETCQSAD